MNNPSLTISFANPSAGGRESYGSLLLEQAKWGQYTGQVTKGAIAAYLRSLMYNADTPSIDCGLTGPGYSCMVLGYPRPPDLAYQVGITNGELSEPTVEEFEFTEIVNVSLETSINLKYPPIEIINAEFVGNGYDSHGNLVLAPAVSIEGIDITLAYKVYGALKVTYKVAIHAYTATVPRREEAAENSYDSVVYAHWDGGVTWLKLKAPPGAEEFADSEAECGFGRGSVTIGDPESNWQPPTANKVHREIVVDYCSQEIFSDNTY